jgi:hypothetical protein
MLEALVALADWDALTAFLPRARTFTEAFALVRPTADRAEGLATPQPANVPRRRNCCDVRSQALRAWASSSRRRSQEIGSRVS